MKVTFQYMCDEICRFRAVIESTKYDLYQKDTAFTTLVWTWIHGEHDMSSEEEVSMGTMIQSQMLEWSRRREYELARIEGPDVDAEVEQVKKLAAKSGKGGK